MTLFSLEFENIKGHCIHSYKGLSFISSDAAIQYLQYLCPRKRIGSIFLFEDDKMMEEYPVKEYKRLIEKIKTYRDYTPELKGYIYWFEKGLKNAYIPFELTPSKASS
jgi:hypothetical protein